MRTGTRIRQAYESVIELGIPTSEFNEIGAAIVLSTNPFRLLVPTHLVLAIEDGSACGVTIDGSTFRNVIPISSPLLQQHELAVLQIDQPAPLHLRAIGLSKRWVDTCPGQIGVLVTPHALSSQCRSGPILSVQLDGKASIAILDVPVNSGDSGSAMFVDGVPAGIVQGRRPDESGSKAIVILFSKAIKEELCQLAQVRKQSLSKVASIGLILLAFLCLTSAPLPNRSLSIAEPPSEVSSEEDAGEDVRHYSFGAMPHAIEFVGDRGFVAQFDTGSLEDFDLQTGDRTTVANCFLNQPCDMAVGNDGTLFCVNESGRITEIDVATGTLLGGFLLQDFGLASSDIVMGIEALQDGFFALFYRDDQPYLLMPDDHAVLPFVSSVSWELAGLQEMDGRLFTLAWQDMKLYEITWSEGVARLVLLVDIADYIASNEIAAEGLRNFYIRDGYLYLTSVYYPSSNRTGPTLHILKLATDL